jgi:hypothetical protein
MMVGPGQVGGKNESQTCKIMMIRKYIQLIARYCIHNKEMYIIYYGKVRNPK